MVILASPNTLGHWGYLLSSFALTIYRFGLFLSKKFEEKKLCVKVLLIGPWLLASIITWGTTALKCLKRFNRHSLGYTFDCSSCETLFFGFSFLDFDLYTGLAIPLIMAATYAMIIFSIHHSRSAHRVSSQSLEKKLASQYLVICCSQFLATFSFYVIPKIGNGSDWSTLALNSVVRFYDEKLRSTCKGLKNSVDIFI
ncbi:unnamed protein product [Cylicocyclus nassatus]|uniref:Uncharacterized protein n=1 Tax=Cylicocyclus nassatus TaxID=53992 RepID=A0AA36GJ94_CYLNA|nr:unnamed protein product [Cylicocyclus nassatus]